MKKTTKVFGFYETPEHAGFAVDEFVRNGFKAVSITVLPGGNQSSRAFAEQKNTKLPLTALDHHGDVPPDGTWGLLDPECGPQEGSISRALAAMEITMEGAEGAILEGKVLLSVDCVSAQSKRRVNDILINTGALETGVSSTPHPGYGDRALGGCLKVTLFYSYLRASIGSRNAALRAG